MIIFGKDAYWSDAIKGLCFKVLFMLLTIYNVRLMIKFLGNDIYGDWITLSSIAAWMNVGDLGIGNGLRNEVSRYYAKEDKNGIFNCIKQTNSIFAMISIVMFFCVLVVGRVLIYFNVIPQSFFRPLIISSFFYSLSMFLGRTQAVALGIQKSWYLNLTSSIGVFFSIILYKCMITYSVQPNLVLCSLINGLVILVPLSLIIIALLQKGYLSFCSSEPPNDDDLKKVIIRNGTRFYVLQITSLVLFSTDNVLIKYLFDSYNVTKYSLIDQIYNVGASIFCVFLDSFWSGVAIHFEQNDIPWMSKTIKRLLIMHCFFIVGVSIVSLFINPIICIWTGSNSFVYNTEIIMVFSVYCIFSCFQAIFGNVNYGINRTKMIMILAIISASINLPLSIFFAKTMELGIVGVKLGTLVCLFPSWVIIVVFTIVFLKRHYSKKK